MSPAEILSVTDHRPWELPSGPWVMMQGWYNLLFAHWSVSPEILRPLIPETLKLDTFEGKSWVAVTPFELTLKPRALPRVMRFPEMNCRTYVEFGGKPGIFFFSLDAASSLAVWGARTFYRLPYFVSEMQAREANGVMNYSSIRRGGTARFTARYAFNGAVRNARPGTLEHWLTERYCLYTQSGRRLYRGEIHHIPWPLQDATCEIAENSIAAAAGIELPRVQPLLHFARGIEVLIWPLRRAN